MISIKKIVFGELNFSEFDEYRAFQFRFLCIVLIAGEVVTAALLLGVALGSNDIDLMHRYAMLGFTSSSIVLWLLLRGCPERFYVIAWLYQLICLLEYSSALYFVSADEMRVIWFFTNIPGVYILLGQTAGLWITTLSILGLLSGNAMLPQPYSSNALATLVAALAYSGIFFHIYGARSVSYFLRMRESNAQLRHLASHDTLTNLLNGGAYYRACDHLIQLARRQRSDYAVLFVDLDHFKKINDTYGHEAGDRVLQAVSHCLQGSVRQSDLIGRIGGEEFSLFLPDTQTKGALQLAEQIRARIQALPIDIGGQYLQVTASIGVANCTAAQSTELGTIAAIQRHADEAMYSAKRAGRNRVSCFQSEASGAEA